MDYQETLYLTKKNQRVRTVTTKRITRLPKEMLRNGLSDLPGSCRSSNQVSVWVNRDCWGIN